ncbi:reverse transcriptase domain-containing protein [Bacillus pumilus]|uniref:reverse transcriptase domain-containing protein n=1 Tax=Bacillus pumilus TaxID=1408 RepID=UPI0011A09D81|nr:reverse transcriptase domain-containing protein [Bacillus pumilus]
MCDEEKYRVKNYIHFDNRKKFRNVKDYVTNPNKVALHSFLPFIQFTVRSEKYIDIKIDKKNGRPIKEKFRNIMYAGHLDNFIYKYYADEFLNKKYNAWCEHYEIDDCSIAYRNNKKGKSNIDSAAEVINDIVCFQEVYIFVGDFKEFFDRIDHRLLKEHLKTVLNVESLSKDWFNIYKSVTKYGYYYKAQLKEQFGTDKQLRQEKRFSYFNQLKDFREFQRETPCHKNEQTFGIPQGTAISAVFANVYAIEFDSGMKVIANKFEGRYRRYSDDFILIIPKKSINLFVKDAQVQQIESEVKKLAQENKIIIQNDKTKLLEFKKGVIRNVHSGKIDNLDYLGFIFDGKTVTMRGKSPYKFYRKAYKLIGRAVKIKEKKKLKKYPYRKRIYGLYTDLGISNGDFGNFITYGIRAQQKFDLISPLTDNRILQQIKHRKKKIEKKLGYRIHTRFNSN